MFIKVFLSDKTHNSLNDVINKAVERNCRDFDIETALVRALMQKECEAYPFAFRDDKSVLSNKKWAIAAVERFGFNKDSIWTWSSIGIMQQLYIVSYDLGFRATPEKMFNPDISIMYGCMQIKALQRRFKTVPEILSAYNQGGVYFRDLDGDGIKDEDEEFNNQDYVDQAYKYYLDFKNKNTGG